MKKLLLTVIAALASFNAYALPITVDSTSAFTIYYDGINGDPISTVDGLTAEITFSNFNFTYDGSTNTTVSFDYSIFNSSSDPVTASRISGMGFDTTPTVLSDPVGTATGVFTSVTYDGTVPNALGKLEFCISAINCGGGAGSGVEKGNTGTGSASLYYLGI